MNRRKLTRVAAVAAAASLATLGGASAAQADKVEPGGSAPVGVGVDIEALGELYMEVAAGSITLAENGSDDDARRFAGSLPEVTVTDTRKPSEVPADVSWYVLGTASPLTNGTGDVIPAEYVGWVPQVTDGQGQANVVPGEEVESDFAGEGPGLVSTELLFWDLGPVIGEPHATAGVFKATAAVNLHTPVTVAGGQYAGVVTLSLFED